MDDDELEMLEKEVGTNWDYVIMFANLDPPKDKDGNQHGEDHGDMKKFREIEKQRKTILKHLKKENVGLLVSRKKSQDDKVIYVLITAPDERLKAQAEYMQLSLLQKPEFGSGYFKFEEEQENDFVVGPEGLFTKSNRINLLQGIITGRAVPIQPNKKADVSKGEKQWICAEINTTMYLKSGAISKIFPLHEPAKKLWLINNWAKASNIFGSRQQFGTEEKKYRFQPLLEIKNYFGEEIAFYFAWLGFYTLWLLFASIVGIIIFIFWLADKFGPNNGSISLWPVIIYSIFLAIWSTLFLEYWKRRNSTLAFEWGVLEFEGKEFERPDFQGEDRNGVYQNGEWLELDPSKCQEWGIPVPTPTKYYPTTSRRAKLSAAGPLLGTIMVACMISTACVLSLRLLLQGWDGFWGGILGGVVNSFVIIMINTLTRKLALLLTNWENHRTQTNWDDAFLFKVFLFYFLTAYTSLFYIAYFKNGVQFWGVQSLKDACKSGRNDYRTISGGCADELTMQLVSILLTNMIVGQSKEVLIPYLKSKFMSRSYAKSLAIADEKKKGEDMKVDKTQIAEQMKNLPPWERESKLGVFEGTFDEYSEMVIQFGYVTMFASAFTLAPLLAFINNVIEVRTDAFKLITAYSRPGYKGAQDIGNWFGILSVLSILAVINNCFLIGFAFEPLFVLVEPLVTNASDAVTYGIKVDNTIANDIRVLILSQLEDQRFWRTAFAVFGVIVILEHILLFAKYLISFFIPDEPGYVHKQLALQEYLREEQYKKQQGIVKVDFDMGSNDVEVDLNKTDDIDVDKELQKANATQSDYANNNVQLKTEV